VKEKTGKPESRISRTETFTLAGSRFIPTKTPLGQSKSVGLVKSSGTEQ